jgi:hypothetical protein
MHGSRAGILRREDVPALIDLVRGRARRTGAPAARVAGREALHRLGAPAGANVANDVAADAVIQYVQSHAELKVGDRLSGVAQERTECGAISEIGTLLTREEATNRALRDVDIACGRLAFGPSSADQELCYLDA